jgi:hypothetical protein
MLGVRPTIPGAFPYSLANGHEIAGSNPRGPAICIAICIAFPKHVRYLLKNTRVANNTLTPVSPNLRIS